MRLALKIAIVESGKSQRLIAAACAIPENRLSEIVQGWTEPRMTEQHAIAAAVGRPVGDLFDAAAEIKRGRQQVGKLDDGCDGSVPKLFRANTVSRVD